MPTTVGYGDGCAVSAWLPILSALLGAVIALAVSYLSNRSQDARERRRRRQEYLSQKVHAYGVAYAMASQSMEHSDRTEKAGVLVLKELTSGSLTPEQAHSARMVIADHFHAIMANDEALASFLREHLHQFDPEDIPVINRLIYSVAARKVEMLPPDQGIRSRLPLGVIRELALEPMGDEVLEGIRGKLTHIQKELASLSNG